MPDSIFINYRRQIDAGIAGRIYDSLTRALPGATIFMDVDKLAPGDDFEAALARSLEECKVLLAVMGPQWATLTDHGGKIRIREPEDYVRKEVRAALDRGVLVIPVLVNGATMPARDQLPPDLQALVRRQGMEIRHERFNADVQALADTIGRTTAGAQPRRWRMAAALALLLTLLSTAGVAYWWRSAPGERPTIGNTTGETWSAWSDQAGHQAAFERNLAAGRYPRQVEAMGADGSLRYRGLFAPMPKPGFEFGSHHSVDDAEFARLDADYRRRGMQRVSHQRIVAQGRAYNQGTWIKP